MQSTDYLVVLGSINVDHMLSLQQFPRPGETLSGQRYQVAFGGKGANQAVAAARSGATTRFIACVGDDDAGAQVRRQLSADQVDISSVQVCADEATGVALIFVNSAGENEIGIYPGANNALTPQALVQYEPQICQAGWLLMQLESPAQTVLAAAKIAAEAHTQVVLNPAPAQPLPDELLALVSIITPNETEAEKLTGVRVTDDASAARAAQVLHNKGVETVLITLGSRGVWRSVRGDGACLPAFSVRAVDTVAAGDTFNGALLTALLEGKALDTAIRFAHGAAAIAVTRYGAQPSVPWRQEIDCFLQAHGY